MLVTPRRSVRESLLVAERASMREAGSRNCTYSMDNTRGSRNLANGQGKLMIILYKYKTSYHNTRDVLSNAVTSRFSMGRPFQAAEVDTLNPSLTYTTPRQGHLHGIPESAVFTGRVHHPCPTSSPSWSLFLAPSPQFDDCRSISLDGRLGNETGRHGRDRGPGSC